MKILFITSVFPRIGGGIADYTLRLIESLRNEKYELHLLTSDDPRIVEKRDGYKIHARIRGWSMSNFRIVQEVIDDIRPDLIHIQYDTILSNNKKYLLNVLPFLIKINYRHPKVITTIHEFREHRLRWKLRVLLDIIFSDRCIFVDLYDLEIAQNQYFFIPKGKFSYIPIGSNIIPPPNIFNISKQEIRRKLNLQEDDLVLFHFGVISPHKGLDYLLKAFEKIAPEEENTKLLLISNLFSEESEKTKYQKSFIAKLKQSAFKDRILTLKDQNEANLSLYMLAADIAIFPFTFGVTYQRGSFLATLAHGLPVITTYHPQFYPCHIVNGKDAVLISINNMSLLSEKITELIKNKKMREEISHNARRFYESHFSWCNIAKKTSALYDEITL